MLGTRVDSFPAPLPLLVVKRALQFLRENVLAVLFLSVLILIPCFWHAHIQAGDLGSHIYNAWLAHLAERQ